MNIELNFRFKFVVFLLGELFGSLCIKLFVGELFGLWVNKILKCGWCVFWNVYLYDV